MAEFMVVSDKPLQGHQEFLADLAKKTAGYKVKGVAAVFLLDERIDERADVLTAYFNMNMQDRQIAAAEIQADIVDGIVRANIRRYLEELDEDQEEDEA